MNLFFLHETSQNHLSADESRHAVKVLRLVTGDEIVLTDGKGNLYTARLSKSDPKACGFEITSTSPIPRRSFSIHLAISPTKNSDRMEWMVEKCVEIGLEKISFVLCKTSERKSMNIERVEKIAVNALKQSQQAWLPMVAPMIPFEKFIGKQTEMQKFIACVDEKNPNHLAQLATPKSDYLVLIGPEGDFTKEELAMAISFGFQKVNLGPTRLRTETAGLFSVTALNILNQKYHI